MAELKHKSVTVRVPATSANLGPGFDCLGMALDLWNSVHMEVGQGASVLVTGQGADELPHNTSNLVIQAAHKAFHKAGVEPPALKLHSRNMIPLSRGLGSSSAAIVGGLVAANALMGEPLTRKDVLALAVEMEGHPDNVTPALLGGFRIVVQNEGQVETIAVPVPEGLHAVLLIPDMPLATSEMRAVLPKTVPMADAVFNTGRAALLVGAFATGNFDVLRVATQDRLHQPHRQKVYRAMKIVFRQALVGGALGVFLSGAGSTILALTKGAEMTVAYEMFEAARLCGHEESDVKVVRPSPIGAHVIDLE